MIQQYAKRKSLLQERFQPDQPDLDVDLARVMHAKELAMREYTPGAYALPSEGEEVTTRFWLRALLEPERLASSVRHAMANVWAT